MFKHPTNKELTNIANYLNIPTIPREEFLSALIDVYIDFPDVTYTDIVADIMSEYLEYQDTDHPHYEKSTYGYLYYYDGDYENCVAIN